MSNSPLFFKTWYCCFLLFPGYPGSHPSVPRFCPFDPENVHGRLATVLGVQFDMVVDKYQVPICTHVLDFCGAFREFLQESGDPVLKGLFPVVETRVVLDIVIVRQLVNDFRMVFIEDLVPEIGSQFLLFLKWGAAPATPGSIPHSSSPRDRVSNFSSS